MKPPTDPPRPRHEADDARRDAQRTDIRRNTVVVSAANLLGRLTGLAREIVFAATFGAGMQSDAFNASFRVASLFRELFAEGSLSNAFVPLFAEVDEREGRQGAWALANAFLGVLLVCLAVVTLLTWLLAEPLVHVVAQGFYDIPGKVELTATLNRVLAPFVAFISVASVFMGMLNVRGRFFLPAAAPILFNLMVIAGCLASDRFSALTGMDPIVGVAWAALLGGASQALVQFPLLRRLGFRFRPNLRGHPALRRLVGFIVPAVVAVAVVQVNLFIEMQLASRFGDGPVSWLMYSFRLVQLPLSIIAGAVAVASLAGLSVLVARGDREGFRSSLVSALNLNSFLVIPAAVGMGLLAEPLIRVFFERGAFTPADTAATARLLEMYAIACFGICTQRVVVPVFFSLGDPRTPMWAGLISLFLKLPVALGLVYTLGMGVAGLPLSHAILVTGEVAVLAVVLQRRVGGLGGPLLRSHLRMLAAAGVLAAVLVPLRGAAGGPAVLGVVAVGAAAYFAAALALGIPEARLVLGRVFGRLLRRPPPGLPPTVDPETKAALHRLAARPHGPPPWVEGRAEVPAEGGRVEIRARGGVLTARWVDGPTEGELPPPGPVAAVMRVGGGPPVLAGLLVGEDALRAEGDRVAPGRATGPVLPVEPRPGGD